MRGVKYIGPVNDYSGYGAAARNYALSLHKAGVPLTLFPRNFDPKPPPTSSEEEKKLLNELVGKRINYDVVLIHLTPDLYPQYIEKGKYNIGYVAWETTGLHPRWVNACNSVQEMWVPCGCNKEALLDSGVKVPVHVIPHGIDTDMFLGLEDQPFHIKGLSENTFKFYGIFQWMYRKNPEGLLRAYFNAFDDSDDVALLLKTYRMGMSRDKEYIRDKILEIKKDMNIGHYPKVILISDLLSKTQMAGIHVLGDCCVGLHRGEGWGLPLFEAGLAGNPVIATGWGGNTEFMNENNSYLVNYQMSWVSRMAYFNHWYLGNHRWAEPDQCHASDLMRHVYDHREEAFEKGKDIKEFITKNYSWSDVASMITARLGQL